MRRSAQALPVLNPHALYPSQQLLTWRSDSIAGFRASKFINKASHLTNCRDKEDKSGWVSSSWHHGYLELRLPCSWLPTCMLLQMLAHKTEPSPGHGTVIPCHSCSASASHKNCLWKGMLSAGEANYTSQLGFRKGKTTQRVPQKHEQHTDKLFQGTRNQPGPSIAFSQPVCNAGTKAWSTQEGSPWPNSNPRTEG